MRFLSLGALSRRQSWAFDDPETGACLILPVDPNHDDESARPVDPQPEIRGDLYTLSLAGRNSSGPANFDITLELKQVFPSILIENLQFDAKLSIRFVPGYAKSQRECTRVVDGKRAVNRERLPTSPHKVELPSKHLGMVGQNDPLGANALK